MFILFIYFLQNFFDASKILLSFIFFNLFLTRPKFSSLIFFENFFWSVRNFPHLFIFFQIHFLVSVTSEIFSNLLPSKCSWCVRNKIKNLSVATDKIVVLTLHILRKNNMQPVRCLFKFKFYFVMFTSDPSFFRRPKGKIRELLWNQSCFLWDTKCAITRECELVSK